jgi:hypothetical protein
VLQQSIIAYKFYRSKYSFFMFLNDCIDTNSDIHKKYCIPKKNNITFFNVRWEFLMIFPQLEDT